MIFAKAFKYIFYTLITNASVVISQTFSSNLNSAVKHKKGKTCAIWFRKFFNSVSSERSKLLFHNACNSLLKTDTRLGKIPPGGSYHEVYKMLSLAVCVYFSTLYTYTLHPDVYITIFFKRDGEEENG